MDRKLTLVSMENDKKKEELHIRTALQKCVYPNWICEKVKQDQQNRRNATAAPNDVCCCPN